MTHTWVIIVIMTGSGMGTGLDRSNENQCRTSNKTLALFIYLLIISDMISESVVYLVHFSIPNPQIVLGLQ